MGAKAQLRDLAPYSLTAKAAGMNTRSFIDVTINIHRKVP